MYSDETFLMIDVPLNEQQNNFGNELF